MKCVNVGVPIKTFGEKGIKKEDLTGSTIKKTKIKDENDSIISGHTKFRSIYNSILFTTFERSDPSHKVISSSNDLINKIIELCKERSYSIEMVIEKHCGNVIQLKYYP